MKEGLIDYAKFVTENQSLWRTTKKGVFSRPQELPWLSKPLDAEMKRAFEGYIDPNFPPILVSWSVLKDSTPGSRYRVLHGSADLIEYDSDAFSKGIQRTNEWLTDHVAGTYFKRLGATKLGKIPRLFGKIGLSASGYQHEMVSKVMKAVVKRSGIEADEFDNAVLDAVFKHETDSLDHVVKDAKIGWCEDIWELGTLVGQLDITDEKPLVLSNYGQPIKSNPDRISAVIEEVKNITTLGGHISELGTANLTVGSDVMNGAFVGAFNLLIIALDGWAFNFNPDLRITSNIAVATFLTSLLLTKPFTIIHEAVHYYSSDQNYSGILDSRIK